MKKNHQNQLWKFTLLNKLCFVEHGEVLLNYLVFLLCSLPCFEFINEYIKGEETNGKMVVIVN